MIVPMAPRPTTPTRPPRSPLGDTRRVARLATAGLVVVVLAMALHSLGSPAPVAAAEAVGPDPAPAAGPQEPEEEPQDRAEPAEADTGAGDDDERAGRSGLPPAPEPYGIRPSRPRGSAGGTARPAEPDVGPAHPPRRASSRAFGLPLTLEVRDLPRPQADAALRAAVAEIHRVEDAVALDGGGEGNGNDRATTRDTPGGATRVPEPADRAPGAEPATPTATTVAAVNAAAGHPVTVTPLLADLLGRALAFCRWSDRAHGPLGGHLYRLWGLREPVAGRPGSGELRTAARRATCAGIEIAPESDTVMLAPEARLDLWGFARGFAVDRAVRTLEESGVDNGLVEVGQVRRAFGPGEDGRGWPVTLPVFPGQDRPLDRVWLRDEALAVVSSVHDPILLGGDRHAPYLDQRSGRPAEGVTGVVVVTELGVDAEALAVSLLVMGNREGLLRLGSLEPEPAVLWLLGRGEGAPVLSQHGWSRIALR